MSEPLGDSVRISTTEREQAIEALGEHMSTGRLDLAEYEKRVDEAIRAESVGDLRPIFADLPNPRPAIITTEPKRLRTMNIPVGTIEPVHADVMQSPPAYARTWGLPEGKSGVLAGFLNVVLPVGVGRFYLGDNKIGAAQLALSFVGVGMVWSMIDGIALIFGAGPRRR